MIPGCCGVPLPQNQCAFLQYRVGSSHVRDSVRLSTSCGTVCKNGGIVAFQHVVQQRFGGALIDVALGGVIVEDLVESEGLVFCFLAVGHDRAGETGHWVALGWVEDSLQQVVVSIADRSTNEVAQGQR